jgi:ABC-type branched-subunit amino acid transport system substrate-binding protein
MRNRRATTALLVGALCVASAGCGARWTAEQHDLAMRSLAGGGASASGSASSGATGSGSGTGAAGAGPVVTVDAGATGGAGATGDGGATDAGTAGGGEAGGPAGVASSLPCAAPSDAPGVTDTDITVGTVQSLSGPVPGLGASNLAAIQAYVAFRNTNGGVCGRQLVLRSGDDGADNARNRSIIAEMGPQIIGFLAGTAGGADGGADVIDSQQLPAVGTAISPGIERSPTYYGLNPPLASYDVAIGKYRFLFEQGVRKAAVVYISAASAPQQAQREMQLMRAAGIEVVNEQALPLSTLSYDSAARAVANSGADYLLFFHADGPSASMAQAMDDTGDELKFEEYIVAYGSNFPELAGPAAEGASSWLYALPAEDGGAVPEQASFLEWMAQVAPDSSVDTFAAQGWSSAKLLVDSLEALPGPISREALLGQLAATGTYDAGGLLGPVDVGAHISSGCVVGMIYRDGAWQRLAPASGFLC